MTPMSLTAPKRAGSGQQSSQGHGGSARPAASLASLPTPAGAGLGASWWLVATGLTVPRGPASPCIFRKRLTQGAREGPGTDSRGEVSAEALGS